VIALLIVTVPKLPASRQSISPPAAVLLSAPAKVRQGEVRLHGLVSFPVPDTHVRVACALADVAQKPSASAAPRLASLFMAVSCEKAI